MKLEQNIPKLYAFMSIWGLFFLFPVYVIIMLQRGIPLSQVIILQGILLLVPVLLEIPTGYIADIYGRKNTLLASSVLYGIGSALFLIAHDFLLFAIALIVMGVALALESGTISAFVYDTLLALKRVKDYKRVFGTARMFGMVSLTVASIVGGVIADISLDFVIIITVFVFVIASIFVLFFEEPPRKKLVGKEHIRAMLKIIKANMKVPQFRLLVLFAFAMSPLTVVFFGFFQPIARDVGYSLTLIGVILGVNMLVNGLGGMIGHRILPAGRQLLFAAILSGITLIMMGYAPSKLTVALFPVTGFAWGLFFVTSRDIINKLTTSDVRATTLSLYSMFGMGAAALASFGISRFVDKIGLEPMFIAGGIIVLIGGIISLYIKE